jgi:hypothetical protein
MNTAELRYQLQKLENDYPRRELIVEAHNGELRIRIQSGAAVMGPPDPTSSLGRGTGSQWLKIEIPDINPKPKTFEEKVREILGPDLELYDFGNGVDVLPIPDPGGNGWLTKSMSYVVSKFGKGLMPVRALGFELDHKGGRGTNWAQEEILLRLPEVVKRFEELALPILPGGVLPPARI